MLARMLTDLLCSPMEGENMEKIIKALLWASKIHKLSPENIILQMNGNNLEM